MKNIILRNAPRLAIYGHVGFDISVVAGQSIRSLGGAAYYASLAASLITRSVGIVTAIGTDFPISALQLLQIDTSGIFQTNGSSAAFYQEYGPDNEVMRFQSAFNVCKGLSPLLVPEHYLGARFFFITTAPPEEQIKVASWLNRKRFRGVIAIDTALAYLDEFRLLLKRYGNLIGTVFVNAEEYRALNWLSPPGIRLVVKRGSEGASLCENEIWIDVPAPKVDQVCVTTGAGDILAGACLAAVAAGYDFKIALSKGVELATRSVAGPGVEHLRRSDSDAQRKL